VIKYDLGGRVEKVTNPRGAETFYEYYPTGNVKKVTDAKGNETTFLYDVMNRVQFMTDARGAVTEYTYTATGRVETITNALGGVRVYTYDLLGRLKSETNEEGETTSYVYDPLGRVVSVTNPLCTARPPHMTTTPSDESSASQTRSGTLTISPTTFSAGSRPSLTKKAKSLSRVRDEFIGITDLINSAISVKPAS